MRFIFLFVLLFLVSCDGSKSQKNSKVTVGGVSDEQYANAYINQSTQTLPPDLKISSGEKIYLNSELNLTAEESQTLEQL